MKRSLLLFFVAFSLTCLSGCAAVGGLLRTVLQLPGSVIGAVTEAEGESVAPVESAVDKRPDSNDGAGVSIVVAPVK